MIDLPQTSKLRDIADIEYGYTASARRIPNGPRFLRITDIQDDKVLWDGVPFCDIDARSKRRYRLESGDIVFARTGATTGKSFLVKDPPEAVVASYLIRVRLHDERVSPDFLYHFFRSPDYWEAIADGTTGSAQGGFNATKLGALDIPIPSKEEQRRLVSILDEALERLDVTRTATCAVLADVRELLQGKLSTTFSNTKGWVTTSLAQVTKKIGSGATPRGGEKAYKKTGIPLMRSLNVYDDGFRTRRLAYIDDHQAQALANATVEANDVLLNITGASIARCCVAPTDLLPARVNQHVSIVRPHPAVLDSSFLHLLLISAPYKARLLNTGEGGGSTRQAITKTDIQRLPVEIPRDLDEQRDVVLELTAFRLATQRIEDTVNAKLLALDELRFSLFHSAFNGDL